MENIVMLVLYLVYIQIIARALILGGCWNTELINRIIKGGENQKVDLMKTLQEA